MILLLYGQHLMPFIDKMEVEWFGDLTFNSFVLTFSDSHLRTEWAQQFGDNNQQWLRASDLFMASTAIPIAFPWQEISAKTGENKNFPDGQFSDGGTGGQFKKFEDHIGQLVLENGPFETLHIVSPMRQEGAAELEDLKKGLEGHTIKKDVGGHLSKLASEMSFNAFLKLLEAIQMWQKSNGPIAGEVLVSIPKMDSNFGILDFNSEEKEYTATCNWIDANPDKFAVPLDQFVAEHSGA